MAAVAAAMAARSFLGNLQAGRDTFALGKDAKHMQY